MAGSTGYRLQNRLLCRQCSADVEWTEAEVVNPAGRLRRHDRNGAGIGRLGAIARSAPARLLRPICAAVDGSASTASTYPSIASKQSSHDSHGSVGTTSRCKVAGVSRRAFAVMVNLRWLRRAGSIFRATAQGPLVEGIRPG
jgi:hypothetical protein